MERDKRMKKLITVLSLLALIVTGFAVAVGIDIALQGALVTNGVERFPGAMALISILNVVLFLGIGLTLTAAILSLVLSARSGQWVWFVIILLLIPFGAYFWLSLIFGNLVPGVLVLVLPLLTLLYSLIFNVDRLSIAS
jgi:hypothetical protein